MENIELKRFWEQVKEEIIASLPENAHPWIRECITRHESNMEDTATYIKEFYMT